MISGLSICEYNWQEALSGFSAQWHALLQENGYNLSLSPEWINAIAYARGLRDQLRVLIAQRNNVVLGILPFYVHTIRMYGLHMTTYELAGNLVSYHQEIISKGCEKELLRALLVGHKRKWHVFSANLCHNGSTAQAIHAICKSTGNPLITYPGESSPYLSIDVDWEDYLKLKSRNFRYNLNRKEKALRRAGNLEERWFESSQEVDELLDLVMEIEENSWKKKAGIAITQHKHEQKYYQELLPFLAKKKALFALVLLLDRKPIAYFLCYNWQGAIGNLKISFHEAYSGLSPGSVVIHFAVRKAFELRAKEVDFLGDSQHHKQLWSENIRRHDTYFVFSNRPHIKAVGTIKMILHKIRPPQHDYVIRRRNF